MNEKGPSLNNSVKPVHPLVDIAPLLGELNTYLRAHGKTELTKPEQTNLVAEFQKVANEYFTKLSSSDSFASSMVEIVGHKCNTEENIDSVTEQLMQAAATGAKSKVWHELVQRFLPESIR